MSEPRPLEVILVATKIDKLTASARKPALEKVRESAVAAGATRAGRAIGFSAVTGDGVEELWGRIRHAVLGVVGPGDADRNAGAGSGEGEENHVELARDGEPR